jgi:hypothetical protein
MPRSAKKAERKKPVKASLSTDENAKTYIKLLKDSSIPFQLTCSNYTTKIESPILDRKFVYSMQSNQCFAAFAKLKKDVKAKPVPSINKDELNYFEHDFKRTAFYDRVFNVDLKSAYASILFLDGLITKETAEYLSRLPKHDRLASVGMLASQKKIFGFDRAGTIRSFEASISPLENFFYHAVSRTFEIMQHCKALIGANYLFTWVDGIYFLPDMDALVRVENYLRGIGFRYSEEILTDWSVRVVSGAVKLSFVKEGKVKSFSLPARESTFARLMADAMRECHQLKTAI